MPDFANQAHKALAVYLSRGQEALKFLANNDFTAANELLRKRKAAFYNFRTADALWQVADRDKGYEAILDEIFRLDDELTALMTRKKAEAAQLAGSIARERTTIPKFRSSETAVRTFQKSV